MSANVIIFDGMYTANKIRDINGARELVEAAIQDIKRASNNSGWKCPEAQRLDRHLDNIHSNLTRLNHGIASTELALGDGLKGFHDLEERAARQASGLADDLKNRTGIKAMDHSNGETTTVPTTVIPGIGGVSAGVATQLQKVRDFIANIFKAIEQRRQERAKKLENFFYENFPWLKKDNEDALNVETPPIYSKTDVNYPVSETEQKAKMDTAPGHQPRQEQGSQGQNGGFVTEPSSRVETATDYDYDASGYQQYVGAHGDNCYSFVNQVLTDEGRGSLSGCWADGAAYLNGRDTIDGGQFIVRDGQNPSAEDIQNVFSNAQVGDVVQMRWAWQTGSTTPHTAIISNITEDGVEFLHSHISGTNVKNSTYSWAELAKRYSNVGDGGGASIYRFS